MNRFHVHVSVKDLEKSIHFYSTLFGAPPSIEKDDYAKWMLDDPRLNFAISKHCCAAGIDHLGLQVETGDELARIESRLSEADTSIVEEKDATCCYARSDKHWVSDPQGVVWETFHTRGEAHVYGDSPGIARTACCE